MMPETVMAFLDWSCKDAPDCEFSRFTRVGVPLLYLLVLLLVLFGL